MTDPTEIKTSGPAFTPTKPLTVTPPADMEAVASSNITAIGYQAELGRLWVRFAGGPLWCYEAVATAKWQAFRTAPSIGGFFAREIRPFHNGMRVMDAEAPPAAAPAPATEDDRPAAADVGIVPDNA